MMTDQTREALAAYAHAAWSGWMAYLFSKTEDASDGRVVIPKWAVERWTRQGSTPYDLLPDAEKESDRAEADKILALLTRPSEDAEALAEEIEAICKESLVSSTLIRPYVLTRDISSWATRARRLARPDGLSEGEIVGITLTALVLERHGVVQNPKYIRAIVAKLRGGQTDD